MPFWNYYANGFESQFAWLVTWIIKGCGLYLILWSLGIAKTTVIESTITEFEGDGSPASVPAVEAVEVIRELRRAV